MVHESLQAHGLIDFSAATTIVGEFLEEARPRLEIGDDAVETVRDLMLLNAAEIQLAAIQREAVEPLPLQVVPASAFRAIFLTDSGPFLGHSPRERPQLWDVTLYGSDASKLAWLAGTDAVAEIAIRFIPIMYDLRGYCDRYGQIYGRPPIFALRATVWRARIATILNETDYDSDLLGVYESLERQEPLAT